MEKISMKQECLNGIPVLRWKGVPLICIEDGLFVTAEPSGKSIRTLEIAKRMARQFADRYHCQTTVTNDREWKKVVKYLATNSATESFIRMNELNSAEVLLLDSTQEVKEHVLAGGQHHKLDEIFNGYISDFDAENGEKQPIKLVFFTLKSENVS